jgi:hypothetical protein
MKRKNPPNHVISGAFAFLLLGIFAVFSTVMVLLGAKAYRSAVERTGVHSAARISTAYIRSMLRADDETEAIFFEEAEGTVSSDEQEEPVTLLTLALRNNYDGEAFITRIYVYDGYLREWFTREEVPFRPDEGEIVCPAEEMEAKADGRQLQVRVRTGEGWEELWFTPRTDNLREIL